MHMHAAFHKALLRYYLREIDDFDLMLFQIYCSIRMPNIIKLELSLTKL